MELHQIMNQFSNKNIDELDITALSDLLYILEHLPNDVTYTIKHDNKLRIDDYFYKRQEQHLHAITSKYFDATEEDYKKLIGECFINDKKTSVMKVVGIRDDYDDPYYETDHHVDNFLYEKYEKNGDRTWHQQDYIWLQDTAKNKTYPDYKYRRWCLTNQTDMNINSEHMFMLGKDGNFYIDTSCWGDYEIYRPMNKDAFELIREEAIRRDGEYIVE